MLYLIKSYCKDGIQLLKVGYTTNLRYRMSTYIGDNPGVELLGVRDGDVFLEHYFHRYFHQYKYPETISVEWFYFNQEIIDKFLDLSFPTSLSEIKEDTLEYSLELFFRTEQFEKRLEIMCDYVEKHPDSIKDFPSDYSKYFQLEIKEIRSSKYVKYKLERKLSGRIIKKEKKKFLLSEEIKTKVLNKFDLGKTYPMNEIRGYFQSLARNLDINSLVFYAKDINMYFITEDTRILASNSNKYCKAYKILRIKDDEK